MGTHHDDGYSSDVEIYLRVEGRKIPASQVGPAEIILREAESIPASTAAQVLTYVDGREHCREVMVPHEISDSRRVFFF